MFQRIKKGSLREPGNITCFFNHKDHEVKAQRMQSLQGARPRLEQSGMKRSLNHNRVFDFVTVDRFKQKKGRHCEARRKSLLSNDGR